MNSNDEVMKTLLSLSKDLGHIQDMLTEVNFNLQIKIENELEKGYSKSEEE